MNVAELSTANILPPFSRKVSGDNFTTRCLTRYIEAAKRANAHEFILKLPQGYDTMMTERGSNLSQGQRQMTTIARAMVADPKMLILNEATSSAGP